MKFIRSKTILSKDNRLNIYRGCFHGCIYCDSRSDCYHIKDFENIEVKENALLLLEEKLKTKRNKCMIHLGSMSDPYIPLEKDLQYTRKLLELIDKYNFGITLITKSDLVLRDIDILKRINKKTKAVVQITITTYDDKLSKKLEPNAPVTSKRLEALRKLQKEGIPTIVWLTPLLPFINDTEKNLRDILHSLIDINVYGVLCFGISLTLRDGNREYFYKNLDRLFPSYKEKYIKEYGNNYMLISKNNHQLMNLFHQTLHKHHILHHTDDIFKYLNTFEEKNQPVQLSIFD